MAKRFVAAATILAALLLVGMADRAPAFDVKIDGDFTWEYGYVTQRGSAGFFGQFDQDARAAASADGHSLNAWLGSQTMDNVVSGSDGAWNTLYMTTNFDIRANRAIRLRGRYYIGSWDPNVFQWPTTTGIVDNQVRPGLVASEYINYSSPGVRRSFSPGYWNLLWLTADTPWGIVTIGKRPSSFGTGLAWDGEDNRTSESLALTADYGPLRIQFSMYPARGGFENYFNDYYDKNTLRNFDIGAPTVTYRSGPVDMGFILNFVRRHRDPGRGVNVPATKINEETRDRDDFYGGVYLKYFNGQFFFNTEFDWYNRRDKIRDRNLVSHFGRTPGFVNRYWMNYRAMVELGVLTGPAKVSLLSSWSGGPDRRAGFTNNINQGNYQDVFSTTIANTTVPSAPRWQTNSLGGASVYRPYSYLMVYSYGLGAWINADTGHGYVEDAMCYGARLDYAVASNLNLYGSFFKANRVGNGYGWGFLHVSPTAIPGYLTAVTATTQPLGPPPPAGQVVTAVASTVNNIKQGLVQQSYKGGSGAADFGNQPPNIPDDDLGFEIDAGFDWKLLEAFTLRATFAYWQPGNWFKFACRDKSNPEWANVTAGSAALAASMWGINPDKGIDPIFGMEIKMVGEF